MVKAGYFWRLASWAKPKILGWWNPSRWLTLPKQSQTLKVKDLLLMAEILHQLRLVVYPILYRVSYISGGCLGFQPCWNVVLLVGETDFQSNGLDKIRLSCSNGKSGISLRSLSILTLQNQLFWGPKPSFHCRVQWSLTWWIICRIHLNFPLQDMQIQSYLDVAGSY